MRMRVLFLCAIGAALSALLGEPPKYGWVRSGAPSDSLREIPIGSRVDLYGRY
jgi:hypothetical protein